MSVIVVPTEGRPTSAPKVKLIGEDGNAFAVLGRVSKGLRAAGASSDFVKAYYTEATSGDYDHLLQTSIAFLETDNA